MKKSTLLIALLAFAMGLVAAQQFLSRDNSHSPQQSRGSEIVSTADGKFGGDFTLKNAQGEAVQLSSFQGKVAVLYFGYTSCPDVCPTTLSIISAGLQELSAAEAAQLQPIFISVDPQRDHGQQMQAYANHFFPSFIGLTGTEKTLQGIAKRYGAFFQRVESDSALGYLVDHTSKTYLVSKDGQSVHVLPHDMTKAQLVEGIRAAL